MENLFFHVDFPREKLTKCSAFLVVLIHVIDHIQERFWSYRHEILSFHRNRYIDSTAFRDAQKSSHREGIFKTVCNV